VEDHRTHDHKSGPHQPRHSDTAISVPVLRIVFWGAVSGILCALIALFLWGRWWAVLLAYSAGGAAGCLIFAALTLLSLSRKSHRRDE
jgi:zinc transporter ZupT